MEQNRERLSVGGEDGNLAGSTVQGLGDCGGTLASGNVSSRLGRRGRTLVGTLLRLAELSGGLDEVEDLLGEGGIGQRPGCEAGQWLSMGYRCACAHDKWESRKDDIPAESSDMMKLEKYGRIGSPVGGSLPYVDGEKKWWVVGEGIAARASTGALSKGGMGLFFPSSGKP